MGEYDSKPKQRPAPTLAKPASPAPRLKAAKAPEQKAGSWIQPSPKPGKQLVAKVFFRTKDSTIDDHDRALLAELARAYAGNKTKPVKGTFDGFADPRPSRDPENTDLSQARAGTVAREMIHAFGNTDAWYENVGASGRGVDPTALKIEAEEGPEDIHAPYRRVDVYLDGKADAEVAKQNVLPDERAKPPDYRDRPTPFETKNAYEIEHGDRAHINGVAMQILRNTTFEVDDQLNDELVAMGVYASRDGKARKPPKPPWWDARTGAPAHDRGGAQRDNHGFIERDRRPEYVRRAAQLVKDYDLYANYLADRQGDLHVLRNSGFKDVRQLPDGKNVEERLGYLRFMIDALGEEAEAVWKMTE